MTNEVMVVLPTEVEQLAQNVSVEKRTEVQSVLNHVFNGVSKMREQLEGVQVVDENDKVNMKLANTIRLGVRQVRLEAEKQFDAKRAEVQQAMLSYKTEDSLWLKAKQTMQILTKEIEENARWKEETAKRVAEERKELETQNRIAKVSKFNPDLHRSEFENMSSEMFEMFLSGLEKAYNDKIEAERIAEKERLAAIEADRLERERIKAENERLAAAAAEKEKQLQAERAEAEKALQAERAKQAALEAELKAKQDAEIAAKKEAERIEAERKAAEAKAAKAPIKTKLNLWVDSFVIPEFEQNATADEIKAKFEAFKRWAKSEVEKI